jgi:choline dehydrogenase-like flavoprotein
MMFNGVGGSTILYGAQGMRFMPSDFRTKTTDGVGDDWPITYEELAPYYDRIDRDFSVSGVAGDPAMPPQPPYPLPVLPMSAIGRKMMDGHKSLGWHIWQGSNAIASRPDGNLSPCQQLGVCGNGCPVGAKATVDLTHWPVVLKNGGRIVTGARVRSVTHDRYGKASGAIFTLTDGTEHQAKAKIVILAANAVGTARILLSSQSNMFPYGLANGSGMVGKRLMMHPFSRAIGFFDEPLESWQGHWGQSVYSLEFANTRADVGFVRGAKWNLGPSGGPLGAALFPWPEGPVWGAAVHDRVRSWLGRTAVWGIICEDLPEASNFIDLSPDREDASGNAVPRLHYTLSENSKAMLAYNLERAKESLLAAGARSTLSIDLMPDFGWHPLGTCRMGDDPNQSVVDRFGEAHDVQNLFIVDSSIVVTGSCANPSATIAALALRTADHIVTTRGAR